MENDAALVTGGAGFIGSNLVRRLLQEGRSVRVLDNLETGRRSNLDGVRDEVEWIQASVRDEGAVKRAVRGVKVVFHQAAIPSVARSVAEPDRTHEANVTGTLLMLRMAWESGVERFVYASSSSVYGGIDALPLHENLSTVPVSPYGVSKLSGELYCRAFYRTFGFPTVSLRYFNVFGPRQDPTSAYAAVVPRFINALQAGQSPVIYGDGEQTRDFTYVDNVVDANLLAEQAPSKAFGQAFNIAQGGRTSLNELLRLLQEITGEQAASPRFEGPRPGDVRHSQADIQAAERALGYQPKTDLREGLRRTVAWFARAEGETIRVAPSRRTVKGTGSPGA